MRHTLLLLLSISLLACGGGDDTPQGPRDAGTPTGEGIVSGVRGVVKDGGTHAEGQGSLELEVSHTDRLINQKVKVFVLDAAGAEVAKGEGNQAFPLPAGTYSANMVYTETESAGPYEGSLSGLIVHANGATEYAVDVKAPVGLLRMKFSDGKDNVSDKVNITVYKNSDDPELVLGPIYDGPAGSSVTLPAEVYQVKSVFTPDKGLPITEWYKNIKVDGGMARTEREIVLELDVTGLRVDAFNYGRDVNSRTRVYLYAPGADVDFAVARFQGKAGEAIPADPGEYDVRVVYTPSPAALDFFGDRVVSGIRVHRGLGTRLQVDVEKPLGMVRLSVKEGEEDVSDKVELRVMRAGADVDAASPVVDEIGVSQHPVPVGTYDIYLTAAAGEGEPKQRRFMGIELLNGYVWEQTFDVGTEDWQAADKALNAVWPKVRAAVKKNDAELKAVDPSLVGADAALMKAQRAWIDYRDGQCEGEGFYARGGSLEPLLVTTCKTRMTSERTEELLLLIQEN